MERKGKKKLFEGVKGSGTKSEDRMKVFFPSWLLRWKKGSDAMVILWFYFGCLNP